MLAELLVWTRLEDAQLFYVIHEKSASAQAQNL